MDQITKGFQTPPTDLIIFNVILAVGFTLLWPGLYCILHKRVFKSKTPDFSRRVISVVHWFVAFFLSTALPFILTENSDQLKFEDVAIMNIFVYVLFDTIFNLHYKTETPLFMVHHCVLITTALCYMFRNTMRMVFIEGYTLISCTEPILHLRYFLKQNQKDSQLVQYIFIGTFLLIRLCVLSYLVPTLAMESNVDPADKVLLLANYTVGLILSVQLFQYILRLRQKKEGAELGHILRGVGAHEHPGVGAVEAK